MSGKAVLVVALLVALLVSDSASAPESSAAREAKGVNVLQRLLAKREKAREAEAEAAARAERRTHLSEDDREIMTKQIMQAITEVMNSECMADRDYQGWVDFGRRDAAE